MISKISKQYLNGNLVLISSKLSLGMSKFHVMVFYSKLVDVQCLKHCAIILWSEMKDTDKWPNPLPRRKKDWIFHHVVAKPQLVKNKIPYESRVALPRVTNGKFYPIPFSPWWRTDIPILHTKFWISILHMWGIDIAWFNFSTVETISIPHTWGIDRAWF